MHTMQTKQEMFLGLMGAKDAQFVIPVFQRVYSWNQRQCDELWMDIMRSGRTKTAHFMGTLLYSEKAADEKGIRRFSIIDGQQRTTTLMLVIIALEHYLRQHDDLDLGTLTADFLDENYLHVKGEHKLVLSRTDRDTLFSVVDGTERPERYSERVIENYEHFKEKMERDDFDPQTLWDGMQQLLLISADLAPEDNPQLIFESLNSRGTPLTTGDLVRNYLLMSEDPEDQDRLYEEYWKPIEIMFGDDPESAKLNAAIRTWLTIRFVKVHIHDKGETYHVFKMYIEDEYDGTLEDLLEELRDFCLMYSENYKTHDVMTGSKEFRSWDWAKGKRTTLAPRPMGGQGGF